MTACLYAWHEGTPVGRFLKESGRITFEYDGSYAGLPISLSMPVDGPWDEDAPGRVLTSRLPEDGNTRLMQAIALEAGSDDPFDVLPLTDSAVSSNSLFRVWSTLLESVVVATLSPLGDVCKTGYSN